MIDLKLGKIETYDDYDKDYEINEEILLHKFSKKEFYDVEVVKK